MLHINRRSADRLRTELFDHRPDNGVLLLGLHCRWCAGRGFRLESVRAGGELDLEPGIGVENLPESGGYQLLVP